MGTVTLKSYPPPPSNFRATPDVIDLWTQFEQYQKQREQLAKMCYACLSLLEDAHGGRRAVSKALSVDFEVLDRLGELSTNRGKRSNARKVTRDLRPMTGKESRWLEAIIPELILRTGQIAAGYFCALAFFHDPLIRASSAALDGEKGRTGRKSSSSRHRFPREIRTTHYRSQSIACWLFLSRDSQARLPNSSLLRLRSELTLRKLPFDIGTHQLAQVPTGDRPTPAPPSTLQPKAKTLRADLKSALSEVRHKRSPHAMLPSSNEN